MKKFLYVWSHGEEKVLQSKYESLSLKKVQISFFNLYIYTNEWVTFGGDPATPQVDNPKWRKSYGKKIKEVINKKKLSSHFE